AVQFDAEGESSMRRKWRVLRVPRERLEVEPALPGVDESILRSARVLLGSIVSGERFGHIDVPPLVTIWMERPGEELNVDSIVLSVHMEVVEEVACAGGLVGAAVGGGDDDDLPAVVCDGEHRLPRVARVFVPCELVEQHQRPDLAVAGASR